MTIGQWKPEVEAVYRRAYDLGREFGDGPKLFRATWGLWLCASRADNKQSRKWTEEDHALNTGEGPANGLYAPEIHRLRGVFLKSLGSPAEKVESALRTALEIAEEQGAFLLKLRAATSLARL